MPRNIDSSVLAALCAVAIYALAWLTMVRALSELRQQS